MKKILFILAFISAGLLVNAQKYLPVPDTIFVIGTDIGAYQDGDTILPGVNYLDIIENLLQTQIPPTYTAPTVSINDGQASTQEVGVTLNPVSLTGSWDQNDAGSYNALEFTRGGGSISTGSFTYVDNTTLYASTTPIVYEFEVCYDEGPTKNDNLGNPYPTGKIAAGCIDASTSITGIYPFLWGVSGSDLSAGGTGPYTTLTKYVQTKSDKNVTWSVASSVFMYFCYPASYGNLSEIIDNNGFDVTAAFDVFTVSVSSTGLGSDWSVSYKIYKLRTLTSTTAVTYQFNF